MRLLKLIVMMILIAAGTAVSAWKTGDRMLAKHNDGFWCRECELPCQRQSGYNT